MKLFKLIILVFAITELFLGKTIFANSTIYSENRLKAAYIFQLAKLVKWPENTFSSKDETLNLCIVGADSFYEFFQPVVGKKIRGKRFTIQNFETLPGVNHCHILFIRIVDPKRLQKIITLLQGSNILTIGDTQGFAKMGGIINLKKHRKRIQIEANVNAANRAQLTISSELLKLATIIEE